MQQYLTMKQVKSKRTRYERNENKAKKYKINRVTAQRKYKYKLRTQAIL